MDTARATDIRNRYHHTLERVARAAQAAGRNPDDVQLVVVTKTHPVEAIQAVVEAGALKLGENYANEAVPKIQALSAQPGLEWHMIGHVQSRKARLVAEHFRFMHSLDSLKLAKRLNRFAGEQARRLPVLLEFNVSGESSKHGWAAWEETQWDALLPEIDALLAQPNLHVQGLMTMAPFLADPEQARPYFQRLCRLRDFLARRFPHAGWSHLSMGMSADFEIAIQEGATLVRLGSVIFGPRHHSQAIAGKS